MDECSLSAAFFTQTLEPVELNNTSSKLINPESINPTSTDTLSTEQHLIDNTGSHSSDNNCNTLCAGWTHLHYISFKTPIIDATKTHSDVAPRSFIYHFSLRKPPTEPPKT